MPFPPTDRHTLNFSPKMQAILAAARRPIEPGVNDDITAGAVVGGAYADWSRITVLVQNTHGAPEDIDFCAHGYRVIGMDAREDTCSVAVSLKAGSEMTVARLTFPDTPREPGKECYYAAFLDFGRSPGDVDPTIEHALFVVIDDQLTCHVLGGTPHPEAQKLHDA